MNALSLKSIPLSTTLVDDEVLTFQNNIWSAFIPVSAPKGATGATGPQGQEGRNWFTNLSRYNVTTDLVLTYEQSDQFVHMNLTSLSFGPGDITRVDDNKFRLKHPGTYQLMVLFPSVDGAPLNVTDEVPFRWYNVTTDSVITSGSSCSFNKNQTNRQNTLEAWAYVTTSGADITVAVQISVPRKSVNVGNSEIADSFPQAIFLKIV